VHLFVCDKKFKEFLSLSKSASSSFLSSVIYSFGSPTFSKSKSSTFSTSSLFSSENLSFSSLKNISSGLHDHDQDQLKTSRRKNLTSSAIMEGEQNEIETVTSVYQLNKLNLQKEENFITIIIFFLFFLG
jgi:hypothetical protein